MAHIRIMRYPRERERWAYKASAELGFFLPPLLRLVAALLAKCRGAAAQHRDEEGLEYQGSGTSRS